MLCINQLQFSNVSLSEKVVSAAYLFFVDGCQERLLQQTLTEDRKQNMTFNYNSYFSNFPILCSVSKRNVSFSCAMLPTDCKDLHSQFHDCLAFIQCTKVRIGTKTSIQKAKTVLEIRIYSPFSSSCSDHSKNLPKTNIF